MTTKTSYDTFADLLAADPAAARVADKLRALILGLGADVNHDATKSQEAFGVARKFAWFTSTRMYGTDFPEGWILATFATAKPVRSERAKEFDGGGNKHSYHVDLKTPGDVDEQLKGWFARAYEFGRQG